MHRQIHSSEHFVFLREFLAESMEIPFEISAVIFQFEFAAILPLYSSLDLKRRDDSRVWPANIKHVYGVSFTAKRDITCFGVEVLGQFSSVRTRAILGLHCRGNKPYKMETNYERYRSDAPVREFRFKKEESVIIPRGEECRIGFIVSDGAYLEVFGRKGSKGRIMKDTADIGDVKWRAFTHDLKWDKGKMYQWFPLIRILC